MLDDQVFWWSPSGDLVGKDNVGDTLGPAIVNAIAKSHGYRRWRPAFKSRLFAVGSTLHYADDNDVVWGAGVNGKISEESHRFRALDVRAVRGPRTKQFLKRWGVSCPDVFGDPGILCSKLWPFESSSSQERITYVPHFREDMRRHADSELNSVQVLSPFSAMPRFFQTVASSSLVLSSSLHGIVVAESYGVPAILVENQSGESLFKYADYYEGTGREKFLVARNISEALSHSAEAPDLSSTQNSLLEAFPFDLLQR